MDGRIMRRALHISPNIYDNISSESSTKRIWIELSKEYDEYHILGRSRDCKYHFYQEGKLVLHTVPNLLNKTYPFFFTSFLYLQKMLKKYQFNIIVSQCPLFGGYAAVKLSAKKVPILVEMHGFFYFNILESNKLHNKLLSYFIRYSYNNCTAIRALNFAMKEKMILNKIKSNNISIVENRVDLSIFNKPKKNQKINDCIKLLSIGNFEEVKGHRYALEALTVLSKKYNHISLTLVSGGSLKKKYRAYAEQNRINVKLIDKCSQEELVKIMYESNIYIHTSIREGMPRVILEAMAMKLPVISSKAGFIEGTLSNGINGLLTDIGDVNGVVQAVEWLIKNEELRISLTEKAYQDVLEKYEWNKCFNRYRKLLEKAEKM
jgi:glycosyltransferase, family 1